jgi:glycosyltransferase involved in cell wall biosynthesis
MTYSSPKISVIIPVYNVERYLQRCLDSVINQTFKDIEILCVNDGSTDNSLTILNEYAQKDTRIKILNKVNGGLSSARNYGLDNAAGEYCYFLDSDDWIEVGTIQILHNIMLDNDVDCVVHNAQNIPESQTEEKIAIGCQAWFDSRSKVDGIYEIPLNINKEIACVAWNKLYKMDIINKFHCRFPEGLINEDEAFIWIYMIHCNTYYYVDKKFYNYLRRSSSIMGQKDNDIKALDILKIQKIIFETVKKYKNINDYKDVLTENYCEIVNDLIRCLPKKYHKEALLIIKDYISNANDAKKIKKTYNKLKF